MARSSVLATLDSAPSLQAALSVAEATVQTRRAALVQTIVVVNISRDDAQAALARAEPSVTTAKRDLDRAMSLSGRGDIAIQVQGRFPVRAPEQGRFIQDGSHWANAWHSFIPEDQVLNQQNLAQVKMPLGDNYAPIPDWKPRTPRLKGYPH